MPASEGLYLAGLASFLMGVFLTQVGGLVMG